MLARQGLRLAWYRSAAPFLWLFEAPRRPPDRLLIAPQDIRTADPTVAGDIYAGYFAFGGRVVNGHGRSPFEVDPPSDAWAQGLHGFGWLRHLRAADTALARANARVLVEDWIRARPRASRVAAWRPAVVARRLMSWLSQSPLVLEGADGPAYRRLMASVGQQATFLQRRLGSGLSGEARLWTTLALAELGLCAEGASRLQKQGSRTFLAELGRQILPDGGHLSRDPGLLVDLLLDLLPLRQAYAARGIEVPAGLLNAIDRMLPMLRMFRHPDGALALFNGMGVTQPEALATVLAYDDARALPLANAPYSGFQRAEAGRAVLICDSGRPPPPLFARRAHAGTLSFEFSAGPSRLIVNCGAPDPGRAAGRWAARVTAAHSTLVLADRSSSRFAGRTWPVGDLDGALFAGPATVTVERQAAPNGTALAMTHDGYARAGFLHRRVLTLHASGAGLFGEDSLVPLRRFRARAGPVPFAIRFHLHPTVRTQYGRDGVGVALTLPSGEGWAFQAGDLPVRIEESIFFAGVEGPRRTDQIVVRGDAASVATVAWSLTRAGAF